MLLGSGNSTQISLGVRFYLKDQFSGPVQNMKSSLKGMGDEFKSFQENLRVGRNAAIGIAAAGLAATTGMYTAAMEGAEFLNIMKGVEAIAEGTVFQMERLNATALKLGRNTMFMPEDIASGMRFMAMAGQDVDTIDKTITAFTNLAGATMTTLGGKMGAADIGTNALKAFGWEAERSAQMSDILVAATTNANVSLIDLGNSIRYVAATSRNLKIPVQETVGLLMSLGNAGIQSSMAGTALENMYRYLARSLTDNASKKAKEAWSTLGMSRQDVTDQEGNFIAMTDILEKMNMAMKGMDPIGVQAIFKNIFGVRGLRAAATLARNVDQARGFIGMLSDEGTIGGIAQTKMDLMMSSLTNQANRLTSAWRGMKAQFASALGPTLIPILGGLRKLVEVISSLLQSPVGKFLAPLVLGFTTFVTVIAASKAAVLGLGYALKTLTVSMGTVGASMKIITGFMGVGGFNLAQKGAALALGASAAPMLRKTSADPTFYSGGTVFHQGGKMRSTSGISMMSKSNPQYASMTRNSKNLALVTAGLRKNTRLLGAVGGSLGMLKRGVGLLGGLMGGPWGLAIFAIVSILPSIISAFTSNTEEVAKNTIALQPEKAPLSAETFALIENRRVGDLIEHLINVAVQAREDGLITHARLEEIIESGDINKILQYFYSIEGIAAIGLEGGNKEVNE